MNSNNDFILLKRVNIFNEYINQYVVSLIPSVHRDIKIHLLAESYNLLKNLYEAIYNKGNIRNKYIIELLVCISLIDSLLGSIMKYNKDKHIIKAISLLTDIKNMTYAWKANISEKEDK